MKSRRDDIKDTMPNTYTQIYIQAVFTVQNRDCLIHERWEDELYKYITGIVRNGNHKMLAINGMPDHVHLFINMKPAQSISKLLQEIKASSSKWINEKRFVHNKFNWQAGYGAFSYSKSDIDNVIKYINHQKNHHRKKTFREEYLDFLKTFDIEYCEKYLFKWIK